MYALYGDAVYLSEENRTTNFITEASFINSRNRFILGVGPINAH